MVNWSKSKFPGVNVSKCEDLLLFALNYRELNNDKLLENE